MASSRRDNERHSDDTAKTEQSLRLVQAFSTLDSSAVREALLVLVEHLGAARERPRSRERDRGKP